jgi:hypothetical protein
MSRSALTGLVSNGVGYHVRHSASKMEGAGSDAMGEACQRPACPPQEGLLPGLLPPPETAGFDVLQ